jgi:hypothetical protein
MPLRQALRRYWPFLLGITLFHVLITFVPNLSEHRAAVTTLFFCAMIPAQLPYLVGAAPYSFSVVGGLYWFFGGIATIVVKVLLYSVLGWSI